MAEKTFHEILREKMAKANPVATSVSKASTFESREFDLSTVQMGKTQFRARLDRVYARKMKPNAIKSQTKKQSIDKIISTLNLTPDEKLAIQTLELQMQEFLSQSQVKSQYRALVRKFHPDRHPPGLSDLERRLLSEKFQLIHESYVRIEAAFRQHPASNELGRK